MDFFFVNQGENYRNESSDGYIWTPKTDKENQRVNSSALIKEMKKGDYLLHYSVDRIVAISIIQEKCRSQDNPQNNMTVKNGYKKEENDWGVKTYYYGFDIPLLHSELIEWLDDSRNYRPGPFTRHGELRPGYLFKLTLPQAEYLLQRSLNLQTNNVVTGVIKSAIRDLKSQYKTEEEIILANNSLLSLKKLAKQKVENPEVEEITIKRVKSNVYVHLYVKQVARGKCELCERPAPFRDSKGEPFLETHHVVRLSQGGADTIDNTVALCPNCHRKMHVVADPKDIKKLRKIAKKHYNCAEKGVDY